MGYSIAWIEEAQTLTERSLALLRPTIRVDNSQNIYFGRRGDNELAAYPNPPEAQAHHRVEEEFVNAIRGVEPVKMNTFEIGVRYMEWTEAIYRSAESGRAVSLPLTA